MTVVVQYNASQLQHNTLQSSAPGEKFNAIGKEACNSVNCNAMQHRRKSPMQCNSKRRGMTLCSTMQHRGKSCDSVGSESGRCQQTPHTPHGLHAGKIAGDFGDDHDFQPERFSTRMYDREGREI